MRTPTIHAVRLGLATNSSSTHSIVILPRGRRVRDDQVEGRWFGWDGFTAASREAKLDWLALSLRNSVPFGASSKDGQEAIVAAQDVAATTVQELCGVRPPEDGYVDHQSEVVYPYAWDGSVVDREFFEDFAAFVLRDDVAILGGNDNGDVEHPLAGVGTDVGYRQTLEVDMARDHARDLVARRDPAGWWTLFHRRTGAKVRLEFADGPLARTPTRSHAPELVDLKVSNYCNFGCNYCYMDSTRAGVHAPLDRIERLAASLAELRGSRTPSAARSTSGIRARSRSRPTLPRTSRG
jgi:hypothetical protein